MIRSASKDLRVPQESFVLAPQQLQSFGDEPAPSGRLVVLRSEVLEPGGAMQTGPVPITIGRSEENTISLDGDGFASGRHARIEAQRDGVWILDLGSTNGTWVNEERMDGRRRLVNGDVIRIGETEFRFEQ